MAQYRLWTPIANAFDAYRRRLISEPTAFYEHTWRLIHIQESLVVTLGSALVTRLLHFWEGEPSCIDDLNKLRKMVIDCLSNGSIGGWIDILGRFGRLNSNKQPQCPFVASVKEYLEEIPTTHSNHSAKKQQGVPLAFLTTWQSIAPVPSTYEDDELSRLGRFYAINSLRNKIAHVPISGDTFRKLHAGLRREVLSLLTPSTEWQAEPPTANPTITKWHPPLRGQIANKRSYVTGSGEYGQVRGIDDDKTYWEWQKIADENSARWLASPFVYIDNDIKISLLFRLEGLSGEINEDIDGEYHRFAAEVEPVREELISQAIIKSWMPAKIPSSITEPLDSANGSEVITENVEVAEEPQLNPAEVEPYQLRSKAEEAYKRRNYPQAVLFFDQLETLNEQQYTDVAKLHHGAALWRKANRYTLAKEDKIKEFERAIDLLEVASSHRDILYADDARYEKSKALYHLSLIRGDRKLFEQALKDAEMAAKSSYKTDHNSWVQFLLKKRDEEGIESTISGVNENQSNVQNSEESSYSA